MKYKLIQSVGVKALMEKKWVHMNPYMDTWIKFSSQKVLHRKN